MEFQPVIGNAAGLFDTRHAFANLHIDPDVWADEAAQVVMFDDIVREKIQGKFHVLVTGHGRSVVEVFNVGRDGAVERGECGGRSTREQVCARCVI